MSNVPIPCVTAKATFSNFSYKWNCPAVTVQPPRNILHVAWNENKKAESSQTEIRKEAGRWAGS